MSSEPVGRGPSWMRDHLANERTLLAWVRTALSLVALGLAVAKLATFLEIAALDHPELAASLPAPIWSKVLGLMLVVAGVATMILGAGRARRWSREVPGSPPPMGGLWITAGAVLAISAVVAGYIALG
jgi:putative membrane protein